MIGEECHRAILLLVATSHIHFSGVLAGSIGISSGSDFVAIIVVVVVVNITEC